MALDDPPKAVDGRGNDESDGPDEEIATGQGYYPSMRGLGAGLDVPKPEDDARRLAWHKFWGSQPVCSEEVMNSITDCSMSGPIIQQTIEDISKEAVSLQNKGRLDISNKVYWDEVDLDDEQQLNEVYELLKKNYVEDDGANFRFEYSKQFLRWALMVPGKRKDWHVCLRTISSKRMVAFISAVPVKMCIHHKEVLCVEINYLCAMKGFRELGLAPILISEITRRVRLTGVFQAVYTSGVTLPGSYVDCRYYHRTLDFEKLYAISFTHKPPNMTMEKLLKRLRVLREPIGIEDGGFWRAPTIQDAPRMQELLLNSYRRVNCAGIWKGTYYNEDGTLLFKDVDSFGTKLKADLQSEELDHLGPMRYYPLFSEEDIAHYLITIDESIVTCRVRELNGVVVDFLSFYVLPSQVLGTKHQTTGEPHGVTHLYAAYAYLMAGQLLSRQELLKNALFFAKQKGYDVFNALVLGNQTVSLLEDLQFGGGDGSLHHYAFNWQGPRLKEKDIGLVLC
eukprot:GHVH01000183.1.p1 GENE.GHVH01000183.1~~GHVH01000183.1.p1  ORF type:complete len:508 (+),score=64.73 GHVH01000183.1:21-1544(+)